MFDYIAFFSILIVFFIVGFRLISILFESFLRRGKPYDF